MAKKNRIEILAEVVTKFVATLTLTTHKSFLDDDLINSAVYEKDVIAIETPAGGNVIIDYANKDTATVVITANLSVSFTNIENGAVKYLHITKNATNTISFAGATDVSQRKSFINTIPTIVIYEVKNKNAIISVNSINIDNDISGGLLTKFIPIGVWNMNSTPLLNVAHGLTLSKIRSVNVLIIKDNQNNAYDLISPDLSSFLAVQGSISQSLLNVTLQRKALEFFDNTDYDSLIVDRGWITIKYVP